MSTLTDYVDPDEVRASIGEFVDAIGHEPLRPESQRPD